REVFGRVARDGAELLYGFAARAGGQKQLAEPAVRARVRGVERVGLAQTRLRVVHASLREQRLGLRELLVELLLHVRRGRRGRRLRRKLRDGRPAQEPDGEPRGCDREEQG